MKHSIVAFLVSFKSITYNTIYNTIYDDMVLFVFAHLICLVDIAGMSFSLSNHGDYVIYGAGPFGYLANPALQTSQNAR